MDVVVGGSDTNDYEETINVVDRLPRKSSN